MKLQTILWLKVSYFGTFGLPLTLSNMNISDTSRLFEMKIHLEHFGEQERLPKVLGHI